MPRLLAVVLLAFSTAAFALVRAPVADEFEGVTAPVRTVELAVAVAEPVAEVLVRPGDRVEAGQVLLRLRSEGAQLRLERLRLRASSTLQADAARAEWELSKLELDDAREAAEQGAMTPRELRRVELDVDRDRLAYELLLEQRAELAVQVREAEEAMRAFELVAPSAGTVRRVEAEVGERLRPAEPAIEIVETTRLVVGVAVPTGRSLSLKVGDGVRVSLSPGSGAPVEVRGRVVFIEPVADFASLRRRVRVEVPNELELPAGIGALVAFDGGHAPRRVLPEPAPERSPE